jgi:predicted HTH transcriptional regulator
MIENNPTSVVAAFEMLLEEIEAEIDFVNRVGARAFEARDYDCVLVRFRPSRYIPPRQVKQDLTERQRRILQLFSERAGMGRKEILTILNLELRPLKSDLEDLKRFGLIVQTGKGRGSVWHLAESPADQQCIGQEFARNWNSLWRKPLPNPSSSRPPSIG